MITTKIEMDGGSSGLDVIWVAVDEDKDIEIHIMGDDYYFNAEDAVAFANAILTVAKS